MSLRVIGAGLGRTGTHSLKLALEQLLGGPCYHMAEVFPHPEHVPVWHAAALGESVDWEALLTGYHAAVDWPAAAFYQELMPIYPDAVVIHSVRDPEAWWESAHATIFASINAGPGMSPEWEAMIQAMLSNRFTGNITCKESCIGAFNAFNDKVAATVPKERLVTWQASDGWGPLCKALDVPIPDAPFPHSNSTEEFVARLKSRGEGKPPELSKN